MQTYETDDGHVIIRLDTGDLVLESIREACQTHEIDLGAVVSAIGTLRSLHVHYLHTDDLTEDPRNTFLERGGSWEISAIEGLIADGEPHLHVTVWDGEEAIAGHLEEGNEINALGEILIRKLDGPALTRKPNEHDVSMLTTR